MTEWDDWVGRQWVTESALDPEQGRHLQVTLDREPTLDAGMELPAAWHWIYFHELARASDLGADGHTQLGVMMPPFALPRRMWAGGSLEWRAPLLLGRPAQRVSTLSSIEAKQGRSGSLVFVTVTHVLSQSGVTCLHEEQHLVYRAAATQSAAVAPDIADVDCDFDTTWKFDTAALFRYSALTFNSHRIHYDVDYARDVEGYSGLVVHGPLLATVLLDLATRHGRSGNRFEYRAKSAVTLPHTVTVRGRSNAAATELWAAGADGALAMQGTLS